MADTKIELNGEQLTNEIVFETPEKTIREGTGKDGKEIIMAYSLDYDKYDHIYISYHVYVGGSLVACTSDGDVAIARYNENLN